MTLKIRHKKQLTKVADAVRLLHPDMIWMWVSEYGQVCISDIKPIETDGEGGGLVTGGDMVVCGSNLDLKMPSIDTVTQLRTA